MAKSQVQCDPVADVLKIPKLVRLLIEQSLVAFLRGSDDEDIHDVLKWNDSLNRAGEAAKMGGKP